MSTETVLRKPRVAVVGDFMIDRYWRGEATRISPEAPVPVVKITERRDCGGGAGNVVANLCAMGCDVYTVDAYREAKPIKNRLMVGDVQVARWDEDDWCEPDAYTAVTIDTLRRVDALVISDYNKGTIGEAQIAFLVAALPCETPVFIDSKRGPTPFKAFKRKTFFPNQAELYKHYEEYRDERRLVIKEGADGMSFRCHGEPILSVLSQAKFVRSVSGAGDVVLAAWVTRSLANGDKLLTTEEMAEKMRWVMTAAAIAVESEGTTVVTREQVEERRKGCGRT